MAGDWIKMRVNLDADPKVEELCVITGLDSYSVVGRLHKIWSWVGEYSDDGVEVFTTDDRIDSRIECDGFSKALRQVGWITGENHKITFVNFSEHNGATAKKRAMDSARMSQKRNSRKIVENNATREEKRREEKRRTKSNTYTQVFENWWISYPSRPGSPRGNKSKAFVEWSKLSDEQHSLVAKATKNLVESESLPKDAQRFLRPEHGDKHGDPVFMAWLEVAPVEDKRHGNKNKPGMQSGLQDFIQNAKRVGGAA